MAVEKLTWRKAANKLIGYRQVGLDIGGAVHLVIDGKLYGVHRFENTTAGNVKFCRASVTQPSTHCLLADSSQELRVVDEKEKSS